MTFTRVQPAPGWQINDKMTSGQGNQLDIDHANALDKTGDNISNGGGISGLIDILSGAAVNAAAGGELIVSTGGELVVNGDTIINSGGTITTNTGSNTTINGVLTISTETGSNITTDATSPVTLNGNFDVEGFSTFNGSVDIFGTTNVASPGTIHLNSAATLVSSTTGAITISGTGTMVVSGSTGALTVSVVGGMHTPGNGIRIMDNTYPIFNSTILRNITQPLIATMQAGVLDAPTLVYGDRIEDANDAARDFNLVFTKVINTAQLTSVDVFYNIASPHIPLNAARVQIFKTDSATGGSTVIGSANLATNVSGFQTTSISISSLFVDDDSFYYWMNCVPENGGQQVIWYSPKLHFSVSTLRPI